MILTEYSALFSDGSISTNSISCGLLAYAHRVCVNGTSQRHSQKKLTKYLSMKSAAYLIRTKLQRYARYERLVISDVCVSSRHTDWAIRSRNLRVAATIFSRVLWLMSER